MAGASGAPVLAASRAGPRAHSASRAARAAAAASTASAGSSPPQYTQRGWAAATGRAQ